MYLLYDGLQETLEAQDSTPGCGQSTEDHLSLRLLRRVSQVSTALFPVCIPSPQVLELGNLCSEKSSTVNALVVHSRAVQDLEFAGHLAPKGKGPFSH